MDTPFVNRLSRCETKTPPIVLSQRDVASEECLNPKKWFEIYLRYRHNLTRVAMGKGSLAFEKASEPPEIPWSGTL